MKIYTRKGDQGKTSLFGGGEYLKDDIRIEAYGTIDELNSFMGALMDSLTGSIDKSPLQKIQNQLFSISANLATASSAPLPMDPVDDDDIHQIERYIDEMTNNLEPLKYFLLPGGHPVVSNAHICRTVCRRAERRLVSLDAQESIRDPNLLAYINRVSDFFFAFARFTANVLHVEEVHWKGRDQNG